MCKSDDIQEILKKTVTLRVDLLNNIFLLSQSPDTVKVIRRKLKKRDSSLILDIVKDLPEEMKRDLLPDILEIMRNLDSNTRRCQEIILTMDREWIKNNIWNYSSHIFDDDDYQTFGIFMYLFNSISEELSIKLANLALKSKDEDVCDIGEIYLDKIFKK